jgi:predicted dienelactone hydrolase/mono/diheme cytochrome c family protein
MIMKRLILAGIIAGCLSSGAQAACLAWQSSREEVRQEATFATDIAPLVHQKCARCHRPGQVGPFPLLTYQEVRDRAATIKAVVASGYMPPWKAVNPNVTFADDRRLSDAEIKLIDRWIADGCPPGDLARVPEPPQFPDGWILGEPDLVVKMSGEFPVPADGPDIYRSFVFPLNLPEDRWVKAVELRPRAKSAVHHALFFLDSTGAARKMDGADGQPGISGMGFLAGLGGNDPSPTMVERASGILSRLRGGVQTPGSGDEQGRIDLAIARGLGGYVPGAVPARLPGDLAMALPRGTDIVMQTHFHPSGKPETEQAELALYFADKPPSRQLVPLQVPAMFGFGAGIDIPPGEKNFRIRDSFVLPIDVEAISVGGHAHYICREMQLTARLPSGQATTLLKIDDWDLDWQDRYTYAAPIPLPAGTELVAEIGYDNSSENPENPNHPPQRIRWGRQSNDEMGSITLTVVAAEEAERPELQQAIRTYFIRTVADRFTQGAGISRMLVQLDEDRDGRLQRPELPPRLAGRNFDWLDTDRDESLDEEELQRIGELRAQLNSSPAGVATAAPSSEETKDLPVPTSPLPELTDLLGTSHRPWENPNTRAVVLAFVSLDCPIANAYQPTLKRIAREHAGAGVEWFIVHSAAATTCAAAAEHAQQFKVEATVVLDKDQAIARRIGATKTPEVFVFTRESIRPVYRGRIDNAYADYGKKRAEPTENDLADALAAVLAGREPAKRQTTPVGCFINFAESASGGADDYDPLRIAAGEIEQQTFDVHDDTRKRVIPVRVYLPVDPSPAAVILFSHGLGGNRDGSRYLGMHWAARGYVAVFLQHPGSDDAVWKEVPLLEKMNAMRKAANGQNFQLRVKDVSAVLDQLAAWNKSANHPLSGRLDLDRIGMAGHSFGAVTTQAVAGQAIMGRTPYLDQRIKAALPMSPSVPELGGAERAFGQVKIPWLLMTGTHDQSIISNADAASRLEVFSALPAGSKYELVLDRAEHSAFSDRGLPIDKLPRNPNHHRAILAVSTSFWDAYLRQDPAARVWLDGTGVQQVLESADRWQTK